MRLPAGWIGGSEATGEIWLLDFKMEKTPQMISDLRPADTPAYMTEAWLGCINFALTSPEIVAAFRADTGSQWMPGHTAMERAIDKATGAEWAFLRTFVQWVNVNVWGPVDGQTTED